MKLPHVMMLLLLGLAFPCYSRTSNSDGRVPETPRAFVQGFYDWYVPKALASDKAPAWNIALKSKGWYFTPELAMKLENDAKAQAKVDDEIVGLDFDPFINSQDPENGYEVGKPTKRGASYCINIYSVSSKNPGKTKALTVEVVQRNGHWQFANFYYPNHLNLLGVLDALRKSREHSKP